MSSFVLLNLTFLGHRIWIVNTVEDISTEPFVKWDYSFDVEKYSDGGKYENYWRASV